MDHALPDPIGAAATPHLPITAPEHRQYTRPHTQTSGRPGMSEAEHYSFDDLSDSLEEIRAKLEAGDELVLDSHGEPLAKVIPFRRPFKRFGRGSLKNQIIEADDWDSDEVNEEIARDFYEGDIFPRD